MKSARTIKALLAMTLAATFLFNACGAPKAPSAAASASTSAAPASSVKASEPPTEISMFMTNAGLKLPDGIDIVDNPYTKKVEELANVKFKSIVVPEYADFQMKLNLLLSNPDMPDVIHGGAFFNEMQSAGADGAFLELTDIIKNSPVLSKLYTEEMLTLMRDENGKIYTLRALPGQDAMCGGVNPWLIRELNDGAIPTTPEEWHALWKSEKQQFPDSVPFSAIGGTNGLEIMFKAYGAFIDWTGVGWQVKDGKVINGMQAPKFKDAISFLNTLYKEGILDPTFITNKNEDYKDRQTNKKMILTSNNMGSCLGSKVVPAPLPRVDDPAITNEDAYYPMPLIGGHCISISANSKNPEAAIRLVETLLSDEIKTMTGWGIEGTDFTMKDGKRVATPESDGNYTVFSHWAMMFGYGQQERLDRVVARVVAATEEGTDPNPDIGRGPEDAKYLEGMLNNGIEGVLTDAKSCAQDPINYIQLSTETLSKKAEAMEASRPIIVKAITGDISLDEMEKQVEEFSAKYQFISDEYMEKMPDVLAKLK
ncbi:MAG: extracellular solute-binding protein [Ruthenibacterium sp.]